MSLQKEARLLYLLVYTWIQGFLHQYSYLVEQIYVKVHSTVLNAPSQSANYLLIIIFDKIIFELYKLAIKYIFVKWPCQREPSPWSLPWSSRQPLRARWSQGTWPDGVLIVLSWHILYLWAVFDNRSSPTPCSSSSLTSTTGSFILKDKHSQI